MAKIDEWRDLFELILNNVYSGIIFCDKNAKVVFMNRVYADLLGVDRHKSVGRHITNFFPRSRIPNVIEKGWTELGSRCSLKSDTPPLLVNRIPIKRNGHVEGAIIQTLFKDYAEFKDLVSSLNLLKKEVDFYKSGLDSVLSATYTLDAIIGENSRLKAAKAVAEKYAKTDSPVLILGPTGSGKELFAHAIHNESSRKNLPFVCLNCGAIPRELIESELFGYESGAFTGASTKGKLGKIELAHGGTLYLDEIGDLPADAQAAILRVLETKILEKVGAVKSVRVEFRLVAATNRDLGEMIRQRRFREDLYYRLNAMTLSVPGLSERSDDIPLLTHHFLQSLDRDEMQFTEKAMAVLRGYSWPGNVRELKNVVERAVSLAEDRLIRMEHFPPELIRNYFCNEVVSAAEVGLLAEEMLRFEKHLIQKALEKTGKTMSRTAKILGISRSTLYEKCKRHQLI